MRKLYILVLFILSEVLLASNDSITVFNPSTYYDCNAVLLQYNIYTAANVFKAKYTFEISGLKLQVYKDSAEYGSLRREAKALIHEFGSVDVLDSILKQLNNLKLREYTHNKSDCDSDIGIRMIFWNEPHCKILSSIRCVDKSEDVWYVEQQIRKLLGIK